MPWHCQHPSEIPRDQWLAYLDSIPNASPYLLPEWSLFWQDVWPNTRAEVWTNNSAMIPVAHRHRWGFSWRFAQPYGTPSGRIPTEALDDLLNEFRRDRTVEATITPPLDETLTDWHRSIITQNSWVIGTDGRSYSDISREFSGSHVRNIEKGKGLELRMSAPTNESDIRRMIDVWRDRTRAPRFMLNPHWAPRLYARFAPTGALHWRIAWTGERPVAGTVFLVHKSMAASVDTIVDRDPVFRGVGHFLMAESLRTLIDSGVTRIDLGGVPGGDSHSGLDEFKSGWAAHQNELTTSIYRREWYHLLRSVLARP